jgi:hypothetical protein
MNLLCSPNGVPAACVLVGVVIANIWFWRDPRFQAFPYYKIPKPLGGNFGRHNRVHSQRHIWSGVLSGRFQPVPGVGVLTPFHPRWSLLKSEVAPFGSDNRRP